MWIFAAETCSFIILWWWQHFLWHFKKSNPKVCFWGFLKGNFGILFWNLPKHTFGFDYFKLPMKIWFFQHSLMMTCFCGKYSQGSQKYLFGTLKNTLWDLIFQTAKENVAIIKECWKNMSQLQISTRIPNLPFWNPQKHTFGFEFF